MDSRIDPQTSRPVVAMVYDVDGTLIEGNMQDGYLRSFGIQPDDFWQQTNQRAQAEDASYIETYMRMLLEVAKKGRRPLTKSMLIESARHIKLFPGVEEWFDLFDRLGDELNITVRHYVISSGLEEMISGLPIYERFTKVFASSYRYDAHETAIWPRIAIDYTGKTQFLFKINKGIHSISDAEKVNEPMELSERPIPFSRLIYFGDGATDIPVMRMVKEGGGYSIAVYASTGPNRDQSVLKAQRLLKDDRVQFCYEADYTKGKPLHTTVDTILRSMRAQLNVEQRIRENHSQMNM